jgi:hypothetical protein
MRRLRGALPAILGVSLCAGVAFASAPGRASLIGHVWLVVVLAIVLVVAVAALVDAVPRRASAFDAAFAPRRPVRARPASLAHVERELALAAGTAFDVHYRLRPTVRTLAAGLLDRRGVDLDRMPDRAEALVGSDVWELVRPDRAPPEDRAAPGLELERIERTVASLERLAWS